MSPSTTLMPSAAKRGRERETDPARAAGDDRDPAVELLQHWLSSGNVGLVGALDRDAEVRGLLLGERRELHAELVEVQARDLLVEVLRQRVHLALVEVRCA